MREATDGVNVEVKVIGTAGDSATLLPGTITSPGQMNRATEYVDLRGGVARHVLPGQWTVALFRRGTPNSEASLHPIEVKAGGNAVFTVTPQWQTVPKREP
jgi:hypothetical protein